jgi:hypothetical protein
VPGSKCGEFSQARRHMIQKCAGSHLPKSRIKRILWRFSNACKVCPSWRLPTSLLSARLSNLASKIDEQTCDCRGCWHLAGGRWERCRSESNVRPPAGTARRWISCIGCQPKHLFVLRCQRLWENHAILSAISRLQQNDPTKEFDITM